MAGDWIKMRVDLQSHPKVVRILSATRSDKFRVIGGLHAVWTIFDTHSEDGLLKGYTPELLDHVIGWDGFSRALESVGWLTFDGIETLGMPEFEAHNGKSGKRRAEDQKRKKESRNSVRNLSAECHNEMRTREEERREEYVSVPKGTEGEILPPKKQCPVSDIVSLYHETLPMLPRVEKVTSTRHGYIRQRWLEDLPTLDAWRNYFSDVGASKFLTGKAEASNGKPPFVADLEWLCRPSNFAKVAEGKYHR